MSNPAFKVLIVEDDTTQGRALEAASTKWGYQPFLVKTPNEAISLMKFNDFNVALIDTMLPGINGVELAKQIHKNTNGATKIIMMSAVFTDKSFMKEAQRQVPIIEYIKKPFDLEHIEKLIEPLAKAFLPEELSPIYNLFKNEKPSNNDKISAINDNEEIHGFDLLWIYSFLLNSNITGELKLENIQNKQPIEIIFHEGNITQIKIQDSESYFGVLILEHGYAEKHELDKLLEVKDPTRRLGQRLVDANALSPHAIKIIQTEQLIIRLSKSIMDQHFNISFTQTNIDKHPEDARLNIAQYELHLNDLILSKLSVDWLQNYLTPWLDHSLLPGLRYDEIRRLGNHTLLQCFNDVTKIINGKSNLQSILSANLKNQERLLRAVFFLIHTQSVRFSESKVSGTSSTKSKQKRFLQIQKDMEKQTLFEILSLGVNASNKQINKAYQNLSKVLHPDKLPANTPEEIKVLNETIFAKITEAYMTLKNDNKRLEYIRELEVGRSEEIFKNEALFEKGQRLLNAKNYKAALNCFKEILQSNHANSDSHLHYIWARVKCGVNGDDRKSVSEQLFNDHLSKVPPEDRHSSIYFFAKALYYKVAGHYEKSLGSLKNCLSIDPKFKWARQEVLLVQQAQERRLNRKKKDATSIMDMDISDAMTSLFKKTKV